MKKTKWIAIIVLVISLVISLCACDMGGADVGEVEGGSNDNSRLGDYGVKIQSCRRAVDYWGEDVVIITCVFTNYGEDAISFSGALDCSVYQGGIELLESYSVDEISDNQYKDIKKDVSLEVEIAYELNDTTSDIEVEISEWFSLSDKMITKTFRMN